MSEIQEASYALGHQIGISLESQYGTALDTSAIQDGVADGLAGQSKLDDEQKLAAQKRLMEIVNEAKAASEQAQKAAGIAFMKSNGEREGVITTPSGLQYEVMAEGDQSGAHPKPADTVVTHYHGTLIDGTVFDSSVDRGQPASFRLDGVIKGWTEALQLMRPGDKYRLVLPPELAYGSQSAGPKIAPYSTLIFEVELLDIEGD